MSDPDSTSAMGVSARDLSDADLAQQGTQAHASRNWVFLHGTAEQFRRHTERMLELEHEYLSGSPSAPGRVRVVRIRSSRTPSRRSDT
jgi:hypothetical protein